jgi:hypothetical protein
MVAAELYTFWPPTVSVQRPLLWSAAEVRETTRGRGRRVVRYIEYMV